MVGEEAKNFFLSEELSSLGGTPRNPGLRARVVLNFVTELNESNQSDWWDSTLRMKMLSSPTTSVAERKSLSRHILHATLPPLQLG
jgi:hypothetical protein